MKNHWAKDALADRDKTPAKSKGQVDGLLTDALEQLSVDMHMPTSRPCPTCRAMSKALKKPFGCYAWHEKMGVLGETFG